MKCVPSLLLCSAPARAPTAPRPKLQGPTEQCTSWKARRRTRIRAHQRNRYVRSNCARHQWTAPTKVPPPVGAASIHPSPWGRHRSFLALALLSLASCFLQVQYLACLFSNSIHLLFTSVCEREREIARTCVCVCVCVCVCA
jgi:hypothetical protein